jgi:hypothetical protein
MRVSISPVQRVQFALDIPDPVIQYGIIELQWQQFGLQVADGNSWNGLKPYYFNVCYNPHNDELYIDSWGG